MEQLIKKLLQTLRIEYYVLLLLPLLVVTAGQLEWFPVGVYATEETRNGAFILQVVAVMSTLVLVPLSIKFFALNIQRNLLRYTLETAVRSFHRLSLARLSVLDVVACLGLVSYYLTLNSIGILLSCIAYIVMLSCYPTAERIEKYLNDSKENRD